MFDKKMAMLYILDILRIYSDSNHPLTQKDIIDKLNNIYSIELERKTISTNLQLLSEYGYDINKNSKGYYLGERDFNENEIKYLIDALYSSKSITGNQALKLSKKLSNYLSKYNQKDYTYLFKSSQINRSLNRELFLNIEIINEAIKTNKQISFKYLYYEKDGKLCERKNGYNYKVSPYFLINNQSKYYLLCHMKYHGKYSIYRLDFMKDITILDKPIIPYQSIPELGETFDITNFINEHVYTFSGNTITTTLEVLHSYIISVIIDWFGNNAKLYTKDDKTYVKIHSNEQAIYYWILQYQSAVKIIEPQHLIEKVIQTLRSSLEIYK